MRRNLIVLTTVIAVAACNSTPIPTASPNPSPSGIASPIPSPTPSASPIASPSQSPTVSVITEQAACRLSDPVAVTAPARLTRLHGSVLGITDRDEADMRLDY